MDEMKNALTNIAEISKNLEIIKGKLTSSLLSDDNATITKLNQELTKIINDLNTLTTNNATEYNKIKTNDKWIN